jgi:uncharacterized protein (TIGR03083 family)
MFARLSDEQWAVWSLCAEWTVRDVAGHLIGPFCVSVPRFMPGSLVSGGPGRYSVRRSRQLGRRPAGEIVAILRAHAGQRFVPPGTGPQAPLTDLAVHTRDVARPARAGHHRLARGLARRARLPDLTAGPAGFRPARPHRRTAVPGHRPGLGVRPGTGNQRAVRGAGPGHRGPPRGPGRPGRAGTASPARPAQLSPVSSDPAISLGYGRVPAGQCPAGRCPAGRWLARLVPRPGDEFSEPCSS